MLFKKARITPVLPKLFKHEIYIFMPKYPEQVFSNIPIKKKSSHSCIAFSSVENIYFFLS